MATAEATSNSSTEAEKLCFRCSESWPATPEFFFRSARSKDGLFYCCKACFAEWRLTHPRTTHLEQEAA